MRASIDSIESTVRPLTFSFARSSSSAAFHGAKHRLHREHRAALAVLLRALDLLRGDAIVSQLAQLAADALGRLGDVVGTRADVHADLARVEVLAGVRVDRVRQPAL